MPNLPLHPMRTLAAVVLALSTLPLPAQSLLYSYSLPVSWFVERLRPAGDTNGDGRPDFVALVHQVSPSTNVPIVVIVSGATGAPLHTLQEPALNNEREALGIGDVNGDGRSDVMLVTATLVRVYSGSTGQILWSLPIGVQNQGFITACGIGDYNGNGTADVVLAVSDNSIGGVILRLVRGENGSSLGNLVSFPSSDTDVTLRAMGDLTGDGKTEIAYSRASQFTDVLNGATGAVLWSLTPTGNDGNRTIDTVDLDGDGKQELFFFRPNLNGPGFQGSTTVHDAMTGAQRFARNGPVGGGYATSVAAVGDLDQDGARDFAQVLYANGASSVLAASGTAGRRLWSLPNWSPAQTLGDFVVGLGDLDGDSYGDFAVHRYGSVSDGWYGISGRILAESQPQGGACGGGPFFPQLGSTRPILGQPLTIAGQNSPAGVGGVLVFSLQPPAPTWLGASTCFAWFDLGAGIALAPLTQPQWSLVVPLPLVPQFAGLEIALQAFWSPTAGPLGYDLSNGVWARLGYQ